MSEPLRIAVLGLTHDHVWGNLEQLAEFSNAELVGAADPNQPLLAEVDELYKVPTYPSFDQLLNEQTQLDAVWLFSDNATNVELCELAASRGLHVMVEKPMAHTLDGADRMLAAVRQNNVRLMINWPFAWWPQLQQAIRIAQSGGIGEIWQVKYRAAHAGPRELGCSDYFCDWLYDAERNGAGAIIDYCCYGALLARVLLGMPSRVFGSRSRLRKEDILVDDNGLIVMSYPRATAISEGSWTQIGNLSSYVTMIYGTNATLMIEPRHGGRLLRATEEEPDGVEVPVNDSQPHERSSIANFVHGVTSGDPFAVLCQDRPCRDAQEILESAIQSGDSGAEVSLPAASV